MVARFANLIGGEWREDGPWEVNRNPSDVDDVIGEFAIADERTAEDAVTAAHTASAAWRVCGVQPRFDILDRVGAELFERRAEFGGILSREEGKTLPEGIGEVVRAAHIFKFFAGEVLRAGGETLPSVRPGITVDITREPVGVVALITPWNFPIAIPAWKAAAALAHGNTVILKPASPTPASAWVLADVLQRAGLPAGVFNLVNGGAEVGEVLSRSRMVDALSFTGSVATGARVLAATIPTQKKVQLEMGGKNPLLVLSDADLDVAAEVALQGAFGSTGQRCTASSRIIVDERVHDRFVSKLVERLRTFKVGHAMHDQTKMGPIVTQGQRECVMTHIEEARRQGARVAFGGEIPKMPHEGYYLTPTLLADTEASQSINRDEVFGPVASVIRVKNYEEGLAVANDTEFGLCAGVVTRSLKFAQDFKKKARVGMVMVNLPTAGVDYHVPFGGTRASSYGSREQGTYAREFYTTVKTAYTLPV
ncbi:aldehyde dehydrogenase family protein [Sphingomonas sp.]|uniref:aldehyde dehydrogenase family protein n=1 Tax=Sphingomonas sp. TaxID=28214 RepID=UPI0025D66F85|nr:aldehyde dehydrogenase family protein [Sphingomonas sp.]